MTAGDRYASPAAFRRALTDRLKATAHTTDWNIQQLQRQVAYDRLLERLYMIDDGWIVKGATALLARDLAVRGSLDVDVYRAVAQDVAEADVRRAAAFDLGDWFRFEVGAPTDIGNHSIRIPVISIIGTTRWTAFHVDLSGTDLRMTGQPDEVPPIARGCIPDVAQRGYRAYPLVDHVADKVAATFERHGASEHPSTRYRDLVDLVAIATGASFNADELSRAINSEFERRDIPMPSQFDVPDRTLWEPGYAAEAARSLLSEALKIDDALAIVQPFVDPVLQGRSAGTWEPRTRTWT